jgi:hypothetical protein
MSGPEILLILRIKKHSKANKESLTDVLYLPTKEETVSQQPFKSPLDSVV